MPIRLVLTDFDGTLADSMRCWAELPRRTLRQRGLAVPPDMDALIHGVPMWQVADILSGRLPALGDRDALYAGWMAEMADNYARRIPLKPGARELLRALRAAGAQVCMLSATNHGLLDPALTGYGLTPLLDGVVTEADAGASKRTEAPYRLCLTRFAAVPEETLLLEDSLANVRCAGALGIRTCGVYDEVMAGLWDELRAAADLAVETLEDREPILNFVRDGQPRG